MFDKILIANRGEIACRIIRTAKAMGIQTVAVYSDTDANAPHVELADEAVHIGTSPASESYLVMDKIIQACIQTGAQAVHPGYGFLSERTAFADALKQKNIIFIGPNAYAIDALGDKIRSKELAIKAGVTVVPGALAELKDSKQAEKLASEIGYPVLIKASAGGGGKGMRLAHSAAELAEGIARSQSEALSSFGDDRIFLEKYITNPRHIEIQILGDKHGNVVHLGERECSIQRRHQKVIEEAPSAFLDEATRIKMGEEAVRLAKAVGYDSAGTVEFVVDQNKNYYFLEMNTRLQVEHPVTELVTGLDLVEWMIRIAAGEHLTCSQRDITMKGHAIEARLCAEDPERNYLPATGRFSTYRHPRTGSWENKTIRVDDGVRAFSEISVYYDSLIAKVISHAPTRAEATATLSCALDEMVVQGVRNNKAFLSDILMTKTWAEGKLSTAFLDEVYKDGFKVKEPDTNLRRAFAAVALDCYTLLEQRRKFFGEKRIPHNEPTIHAAVVALGGKHYHADIAGFRSKGLKVFLHGGSREIAISVHSDWQPGDILWEGTINGEAYTFQVNTTPLGFNLSWRGFASSVRILSVHEAAAMGKMPPRAKKILGTSIISPMPGVIRRMDVKVGDSVRPGDAILVIEAMKMENVLTSEIEGTIKSIKVEIGDAVPVDSVLVEIELAKAKAS